jgi:hypothetical protein
LLPNGKVLVAGGDGSSGYLASAELYDPATGIWMATGSLSTARYDHTATLLPNGKILVAGGYNGGYLASAELYNPANGTWTATGSLGTARELHTATLLPNGMVLVAGGYNFSSGSLASAELYDIGLGFLRPDWQPQIATASSPLITGTSLVLTGSRFQGISQASSGNFQDSSTNYPVVQLRAIDGSQVAFLPVDPIAGWSDTTFTSTPVNNFPVGPALVTVFTNGIPSDSKYVLVTTSAPSPTPTPEQSPTPTPSPSPTPEQSPTPTPSPSATATATATATVTPTATATATATPTSTPTPCPTLAAPQARNATNVTASSFTANWSSVSGATGYRLDVSTSNSFTTYVPLYHDLDVGNTTSYNVTGLSANTTYYYRLRAYNACGTSSNSNVVNVKTKKH